MSALGSTFGREVEIATLAAAIDDGLRGSGRLVYVEGHAGIGKTHLLALARAHAEAAGGRVLAGSGGELEHDYGYGVARQLLTAAAVEARERLAALAAAALGLDAHAAGATRGAGARTAASLPAPDSPSRSSTRSTG